MMHVERLTRYFRVLLGSLRFKVAATVMAILVVAMGIVFGVQYRWLRQEMIERLGLSSTPLTGVIKGSLTHAMQSRNLSELNAIVENVSRQEGVLRVFVLDKRGEIKFASSPDTIGTRLAIDDSTCRICHRDTPENRAKTVIFTAANGERVFRNVTPIANEPACFGCHPPRDAVNGVLITDFSTTAIDAALGLRVRHMLLALIATVGATGLTITLLLNRLVVDRLERFVAATKRLGRGSLDLQLDVTPRDEIGALAASFNEMVAGLRRARELRERTELLESVLNTVDDAVVVVDPERVVIALNRSGGALFGVATDDVVGKPATLLGEQEHEILARARADGASAAEMRLRRADGGDIPAFVQAVALRGDAGELLAWVVVARDLTEDKLKERLQGQLLQSEKLAAVGRLAAGIAHELNNPLGNMLLYSKLLLELLPEDDERHANARQVVENTLRCRTIVRALLDYARESEMRVSFVDLNEVIDRSVALVAGELSRRGVRCDVRLATDLPRVRCDPHQIEQVMVNLLENGIEAMDGPDGVLSVFTARMADRDAVVVGVRDTGGGVPPESASRIFDPFYTTKADGTGLGLAICAGIVGRHRGRIWMENAGAGMPPGATFFIELPMGSQEV
jgi:PAS domain S-box-containing protein